MNIIQYLTHIIVLTRGIQNEITINYNIIVCALGEVDKTGLQMI